MDVSGNTRIFISYTVTAHYIELRSFKLRSAVLCTKEEPGSHTGEAISEAIKSVIREWDIEDKVYAMVSYNANVMVVVARRIGIQFLGCAAHKLNLAVSDFVSHPQLKDLEILRGKCRKIVGFYRSSTLATSKLFECQTQLNKKNLKLKQETPTRCNSCYLMMGCLLEVKRVPDNGFFLCKLL